MWKIGVNPDTLSWAGTKTEIYSSNSALTSVRIIDSEFSDPWIVVIDQGACVLRRFSVDKFVMTIVAGSEGQCSFSDGVGEAARFNNPTGISLWPGALHGLITDSNNNCVREINLRSLQVTSFSGTCNRHATTIAVESSTPASVVYLKPQRVVIHPSMEFAIVYSYSNYPNPNSQYSSMGLRDEQAQLYQLWLVNGQLANGWLIEPGSATVMLTSTSYATLSHPVLPHMGLTIDSAGKMVYFALSRCHEVPANNGVVFNETGSRVNEVYKGNLGDGVFAPMSMTAQLGHQVGLSVAPASKKLLALDFNNNRVLSVAIKRPEGRFGPAKKCYLSIGTCACLPSFGGDLCDGDRCPEDPDKFAPGVCGCNNVDIERNGDGIMEVEDCV